MTKDYYMNLLRAGICNSVEGCEHCIHAVVRVATCDHHLSGEDIAEIVGYASDIHKMNMMCYQIENGAFVKGWYHEPIEG